MINKGEVNDLKIPGTYDRSAAYMKFINIIVTGNNRGNRDSLTFIQMIPEQHVGEAQNQGTTESNHMLHCTHTVELHLSGRWLNQDRQISGSACPFR